MRTRNPFKLAKQHRQFASAFADGATLKQALVQAGYSPMQAKKGMAIVRRSKGLRDALAERVKLIVELGRGISPEDQENLVRGRLVLNTIRGIDKGVASAKALGSDKRVSMWQSESQQGIIIVTVPTEPDADAARLPQAPISSGQLPAQDSPRQADPLMENPGEEHGTMWSFQ